ncbi:hypothetical protein F383_23194 [Gossypium arboreum]|uniref:Uncharacterized protein n=1 Tax=Gossypium arboreum TaxID=29729 RepID=A0A0B0MK25_GOSAR|nr:hypothetical protein F383_23194 [Gossypium arboreum]
MVWFIIVLYDKFICISLTKLLESLLCVYLHCFIDIEATRSLGIVEDHHHTIKLYFGTF